jgi:argininosuccinate lyase
MRESCVYTAGEDHLLDARLVAYDVQASIAHAQMLHAQKLLSGYRPERNRQRPGTAGRGDTRAGEWQISLEEEDCHTALEKRLTAAIGEAGGACTSVARATTRC